MIKDIKVFAFVGPSGTGKSYRAQMVAAERDIKYIIDDGLLINDTKVVAGTSAKKAPTKIETVKKALFNNEKDAQWVGYHKDYKENDGISGIGLYYYLIPIKNYNDFKIYVLWSSCYKKDSCNHGSYKVVAVNEDTKEVMYRNSDW